VDGGTSDSADLPKPNVLHNPVYAGAYVYGKSRCENYLDDNGNLRKRIRHLPRDQWAVLIRDHHLGYIDWATFEMNQDRLTRNTRPGPQQAGGAPREGSALLQGLARCGKCGRKLHVYYQGKNSMPGYYCGNSHVLNGRGVWCMRIGGVRIDKAVAERFLEAIDPVGMEAALEAQRLQESEHQNALKQFRLQVERVQYEAERAERSYQNVEPENRLVARSLEAEWENKLKALEEARAQLARKEQEQCFKLTAAQKEQIHTLGQDLRQVWDASTTKDRDRKELLQTLLEEVTITLQAATNMIRLTLVWKTGAASELEIQWKTRRAAAVRTEEDTIDLIRRLAEHHKDEVIAGVLNRQGKLTATGERFTASRVASLRCHWKIPVYKLPATLPEGELLTVQAAADELGLAASTVHRWLMDGFIAGEQVTPGAPWRIRMTKALREQFVEKAPDGYVRMPEAMRRLGVSRQTIMQRVKRGEIPAVHVHRGKRKGLYIKVIDNNEQLFDETLSPNV
jgi:hypothetical protein